MPETYTPDEVEALAAAPAGLRELDAAAARALGWEFIPDRGWHHARRRVWAGHGPIPPPYASGKDWRLWGELWDALPRDGGKCWHMGERPEDGSIEVWSLPVTGPCNAFGATIGIALLNALAAAGRLKREEAT